MSAEYRVRQCWCVGRLVPPRAGAVVPGRVCRSAEDCGGGRRVRSRSVSTRLCETRCLSMRWDGAMELTSFTLGFISSEAFSTIVI